MGGWFGSAPRRTAVALVLVVAASARLRAVEPDAPKTFRHRLPADVAAAIEPAVVAAIRRFSEPECGRLVDDFTDPQGRPLGARLADLGLERAPYLALVVFVDGRNTRSCQRRGVLAVANPGARIVALCPEFLRAVWLDRGLAEAIIIHETLHTLGLAENPPSSLEINHRVFQRCGRRSGRAAARAGDSTLPRPASRKPMTSCDRRRVPGSADMAGPANSNDPPCAEPLHEPFDPDALKTPGGIRRPLLLRHGEPVSY